MPVVPTYSRNQVAPSSMPQPRLGAASVSTMPDVAGQQTQQMSQAMLAAGRATASIATDMQAEANQLRVDEALNEAKMTMLRLTYDPNVGFINAKGRDALERQSGKALPEEYADTLNEELTRISSSLGNDRQRQAFNARASDLRTNLYTNAVKHVADQSKVWADSTDEASIKRLQADVALRYDQPGAVEAAINGRADDRGYVVEKGIRQHVFDLAKRNGQRPEWAEQKTREIVADTHNEIVLRMANNSPSAAQLYLNDHRQDLGKHVAPLERTLRGAVNREQGNAHGERIYANSSQAGSDFESIVNFVRRHEGGYVANDAGKGETNHGINKTANPDVDVKNLSWDGAKKIYRERYWNGIGADKLPENIRAIAFDGAVNQGVSKTNELLAKAGGDPQRLIDLRRQEYAALIEKNPEKFSRYAKAWNARLDQLEAGLKGERSLSSMLAEANQIEDREQQSIAVNRITQLFNQDEQAKKEAYQADFARAMDIAYAKPGGWREVPPVIWGNLKTEDRAKLMEVPKKSDPDTLTYLLENPQQWKAGKIEQFRPLLSEADYRQFHTKGNGPGGDEKIRSVSIDNEQFDYEMQRAGLGHLLTASKGTPDQQRLIELRAKFENVIDSEQQARGRKLSIDEKNALLSRLIKPVKVSQVRTGSLFGLFDGPTEAADMRAFQVKNPANIRIPDETRSRIIADMRSRGITPTDSRVLAAYLSMAGDTPQGNR